MTTLITGASSGIGAALAEACARRGDRLFLCGRNEARLDTVAAQCSALGAAAVHVRVVDVRDEALVRNWLEDCEKTAPIERIFANAGIGTGEETEENVRATFATNVNGCLNVVLPAIELFRRRKAPSRKQILITASIAGYGPLSSCPAYSATKSCMKTWALALRGHLAREGIMVSAICPGFVRSGITDRNTCPMPFFMEAPLAAEIILARADKNIGLIAFPWPMRFASWLFSIIPQRLNEFFSRFLPAKVSVEPRIGAGN